MALLSNIVLDTISGTAVLSGTVSGISVEELTFDNSTKQVTFASRPDNAISLTDFLNFVDQINIFQTAIIFNYNPNVFVINPFGSCQTTEAHDTILNKYDLVCIYGAVPRVCNYSYDKGFSIITLFQRANAKILEFAEWIYFLSQLKHYSSSIKGV